jgi:myosin heavy subunit
VKNVTSGSGGGSGAGGAGADVKSCGVGVDDMIHLGELSEASILGNIQARYGVDEIYTYTGNILVAVNPYQALPIYTNKVLLHYAHAADLAVLPPHVFAVAARAYRLMVDERRNQSILISGESGAGKTETTKLCVHYLSAVTGRHSAVEDMVLEVSPILEAFGNAKTVRNDNSSRFGKYQEIHFGAGAEGIVGARMVQYLLEKSRVVSQQKDERNYHVFYHLLAGAEQALLDKWHLKDAAAYAYLNGGKCTAVPTIDDSERFQDVTAAFAVMGVSELRVQSVWRILAAILHIGELKFVKGGDATKLADADATATAAAVLGVNAEQLSAALLVRTITVRGQTTRIPLSPQEARDGADALAKALYDRLFKWLVKTMNEKLSANLARSQNYIGILDIFGFENFKVNSLEQTMINYANEKLQQQFNHALFELEQREYVAEGVQWNMVEFADGRDCVELIEGKGGLLALLDEQCRLQASTDQSLIDKLHDQLAAKSKYVKPRLARGEFGIRHYAGEVSYQVAGFLDKNRDTLPRHFLPLLLASDDKLTAALFVGEQDDAAAADAPARQTLGSTFKKQLAELMTQLATTHCSYVRTLKPNTDKAPKQFTGSLVSEQLRYSGMLETIRIRKLGYGRRFLFADFAGRFGVVLTPAERAAAAAAAKTPAELAAAVSRAVFASAALRKAKVPVADAHLVGKTKVFVRDSLMFDLDTARDAAVTSRVIVIQARWRAHRLRQRFLKLRDAAVRAQALWRARQQRAAYRRTVAAAIVLQSFARQIRAKKELERLKRTLRVAVLVQTAGRALLMRKNYDVLLNVKRTRERIEREAREKAEAERRRAEAERLAAEERARKEREAAEARAKAEAERARAEAEKARLAAEAEIAAAEGARRAELQRLAAQQKADADAAAARAEAEALAAAKRAEAEANAAARAEKAASASQASAASAAEMERLRALEAQAVAATNTQIGDASAKAEAAEEQKKADRKAAKAAAKRVEEEKAAQAAKRADAEKDLLRARKAGIVKALAPPLLRKKENVSAQQQYLTTAAEARAALPAASGTLRAKVGTLMRKVTLRKVHEAPASPQPTSPVAIVSPRSRAMSTGARSAVLPKAQATLRVEGGTLRVNSTSGTMTNRSTLSAARGGAGEPEEDVRETSDLPIWIELQPGRPRKEGHAAQKATWNAHCVMSYAELTKKSMMRKVSLTFKERMAWAPTLDEPLLSTTTEAEARTALEMFNSINCFLALDSKGRSGDAGGASGVAGVTLQQIDAAQHAMALAWGSPTLRNELFCQIAKQIWQCPDALGTLRGWQLMACCCAAFVPTGPLYDALWDFLTNDTYSSHMSSDAVSCAAVAHTCSVLLQRTAQRGGRMLVLTRTEIGLLTSLGNKQLGTDDSIDDLRVPLKVFVDDHESVTVNFAPHTTAAELLRDVLLALRFTPASAESTEHGYALFERAGRLERSLGAVERVGDVLSKWEAYHKMTADRKILVAEMRICVRRRLWLQRDHAWPSRNAAAAAAVSAANRAARERAAADAAKAGQKERAVVRVDEAAILRELDADRRLSFMAARRLVMTGGVHCAARDAVLLTTLSLAYEAYVNPTGKVVIREHVPFTSYHMFSQKDWTTMIEEQSMLLPPTKAVGDIIDLYMAAVTKLAGSALHATTFDGVTLSADSPYKIDAPVLSLRVSALGVELRSDELAREVPPIWRVPWSFVDMWERAGDAEFKLTFSDSRLRGPALHLRSAQTSEVLSLLDSYYKALVVCPLFARTRRDVTKQDAADAADADASVTGDTSSQVPIMLLAKGEVVAVIEQRQNAVFWLCERLNGTAERGRVPRAALESLFDDPRLLPDEPLVAVEEDATEAVELAASARPTFELSPIEREWVTGKRAAAGSGGGAGGVDDDDEDSVSLSESAGGTKKPKVKKACVQCGKKAKLMIKFKGDAEASAVCRACSDDFKAQEGFASTTAPKDERDVAFEKFAAKAFRSGVDPLAACRWSMSLPNGASLTLVPDEADVGALFEAIKRAMGDTEKTDDAPLEAPLDELFAAVLAVVLSEEDALYDELYCQLMRQLSHNPNAMSRRRGWLLFDVCSGVVAPRSVTACGAALEFVRRSPWRSAAPHTLHRLRQLSARVADKQWTRKHARTLGPSQPEYMAARNNSLVPVDVYVASERPVRVYVEPFATASEVRAAALAAAKMRALAPEWELCEVELPRWAAASKHAAPDDDVVIRHVEPHVPIGDVLRRLQLAAAEHVKRAIGAALRSSGSSVVAGEGRDEATVPGSNMPPVYLGLKRRVYYTLSERRRMLPTSHSELRLEFFETVQHVISGRYALRHGLALELEALRLQAVVGDRTLAPEAAVRESQLVGHLPPTTLSAITSRTLKHRTAQLLIAWSAHAGRPPFVCMSQYLSLVKSNVRLYGSAFFAAVHKRARGAETKCWIAMNFDGLFMISRDRLQEQKVLEWWKYSEFEYKSAPQSFNISWGSIQQPKRMFLEHAAAPEIAHLAAVFAAGVPDEKFELAPVELHYTHTALGARRPSSREQLQAGTSLASLMRPVRDVASAARSPLASIAEEAPPEPETDDEDVRAFLDDSDSEPPELPPAFVLPEETAPVAPASDDDDADADADDKAAKKKSKKAKKDRRKD